MKVFLVLGLAEHGEHGAIEVIQEVYASRELAEAHAVRIWGGSWEEREVRTSLPAWVAAFPRSERP